MFDPGM